jgi:hypothetical protein
MLTVIGFEAVHRKGIKRPEGKGMTVNEQEGRLLFVGHEVSLTKGARRETG